MTAFDGANWAADRRAARSKGMERKDLLDANSAIFKPQGQALNWAASDIRVLVVSSGWHPCLIAMNRRISNERFTAWRRLDHNRAVCSLRW